MCGERKDKSMSKLKELAEAVERLEVELEEAKHQLRKAIGTVEPKFDIMKKGVRPKLKKYKHTKEWLAKKKSETCKKIWNKRPEAEKERWLKAIKEGRRKHQAKIGLKIEEAK